MDLNSARVLVTGAGGFIGSHLTERLVESGASTRAFVRYNSMGNRGWLESSAHAKDIEFIHGDIRDSYQVRESVKNADIVFHLAALIAIPYSYTAPESYVQTNVCGTLNVLQACRDYGCSRVIVTSTSEVYGTARSVPIDENHPLQGQSPYSASKIGADKIAESFHLSFGLPVTTIRPFNTFGPRQSARAVIPTIISQCLDGRAIRLGNLHPTRDLNFVSNTVEGFLAASRSEKAVGQTINLGSEREISIGELAKLVARKMDKNVEIVEDTVRTRPESSEVERLLASTARARDLLNWSPRISLEEGLDRTIEWISANRSLYRSDVYTI